MPAKTTAFGLDSHQIIAQENMQWMCVSGITVKLHNEGAFYWQSINQINNCSLRLQNNEGFEVDWSLLQPHGKS